MLSPFAWIRQWTGSQSFLCCCFFACFVVCFGFLCCFLVFVCLLLRFLVVDDDGLLDYVQVLHQFSFAALNSRRPRVLIWNYCFCNAIKCVKRPGESHEGVGRKKICFCYVYGHTMMRWHNVVTSCMNLPWTGSQSFLCVLVFGFVLVVFVCLSCLFAFVCLGCGWWRLIGLCTGPSPVLFRGPQ